MAGFDDAGVHRADRDLVDAGTLDGEERVGLGLVVERRRRAGVVSHRVPAVGPVLVEHEPCGLVMADEPDAEEVLHLAFEASGGERHVGEAGQHRVVDRETHVELDRACRAGRRPSRRRPGSTLRMLGVGEVVVGGDEREAVAGRCEVQKRARRSRRVGVDEPIGAVGVGRRGHRASTSAAVCSRWEIGQIVIPDRRGREQPGDERDARGERGDVRWLAPAWSRRTVAAAGQHVQGVDEDGGEDHRASRRARSRPPT